METKLSARDVPRRRSSARRAIGIGPCALAALVALGAASCGLIQATANAPGQVTKAILPGEKKKPQRLELAEQQAEVLRFADQGMTAFRLATRTFEQAAGTPEAAVRAARWRLDLSRALIAHATSANPSQALLDTIVTLSVSRVAHERYFLPEVWHEADRTVLVTLQSLEADAWALAPLILDEPLAEQARTLVEKWLQELGESAIEKLVQTPSFAELARDLGKDGEGSAGGLLAGLSLDPLSGLEPTTREIARTRLLAERALFYLRVAPMLIDDQVLVHTLELRTQPEVVQLLADTERVSEAVRSVAATAEGLPAAIAAEREAALRQVSDELTAQRKGLVEDLQTAQEPLQQILVDSEATLAAGERMSAELTELVRTVDAFLAPFRADPDEPPASDAPPAEPDPDAPPAKPFDITEYGDTATRLGDAARELKELVLELDQSLPQVERMVDTAATRGEASVDHAFWRGLQLGLALIAAAAVATLAVRGLGARRRA